MTSEKLSNFLTSSPTPTALSAFDTDLQYIIHENFLASSSFLGTPSPLSVLTSFKYGPLLALARSLLKTVPAILCGQTAVQTRQDKTGGRAATFAVHNSEDYPLRPSRRSFFAHSFNDPPPIPYLA